MSTLRKRLKHPGTYLVLLAVLTGLVTLDSFRAPDRQLAARMYVAAVHAYQHVGRPLLEGRVQCRFRPTCSNYSIEAVQKYGLGRGLGLTVTRIWHCRNGIAPGTVDPVP